MKNSVTVFCVLLILLVNTNCQKEPSCQNCFDSNKPPTAEAGADQVITLPVNSVSLDGSGSSDPDNNISSFEWTKISGPSFFTITTPNAVQTTVTTLVAGTYKFELKVTDDAGLTDRDTMQVIVNPVATTNQPPVANAGLDKTINLPVNNIILDGSGSSDPDNNISSFQWTKISGPSSFTIVTPDAVQTTVTNLVVGTYLFELKVTDAGSLSAKDTMQLIVTVPIPSYCQANRSEVPVGLTFLSNVPGQIQNPEIIAAGNKLIIPAWFSNHSGLISNNVYVYDRITQNWTTIHASLARIGAATIAVGTKVFFAGGMDGWDGNYTTTSVVDIYDISTNTWSVSNLSEARGYCKATVSGNKIFFAGGININNALSNKVDIYNLETGSWSSAVLPGGARVVGAALTVQNKVLFCGGYTKFENATGFGNTFTTPTTSIDIYDVNTGQWSAGTMQVNKGSFAAISVNEKVFLAGGSVNNAVSFHVEELNVNTMNSVNSCLHQPMVSYEGNSAVLKNDMAIFFAYSPFTGIERNKFDIFNMLTGVWSVGVLPINLIPEEYSAIVSVNNQVYAVIGGKLYVMNI